MHDLTNYIFDETGKITEILNQPNWLELIRVKAENNTPIDINTMLSYFNRQLPLCDGIMEKHIYDFYESKDEFFQMQWVLVRTLLVDEISNLYEYTDAYKLEFLMNFEAEMDLAIEYISFKELSVFTQTIFKTLRDYAKVSIGLLTTARTKQPVETVIKKRYGIK